MYNGRGQRVIGGIASGLDTLGDEADDGDEADRDDCQRDHDFDQAETHSARSQQATGRRHVCEIGFHRVTWMRPTKVSTLIVVRLTRVLVLVFGAVGSGVAVLLLVVVKPSVIARVLGVALPA